MSTALRLGIGGLVASAVPLLYATTAGSLATWAVIVLGVAWIVWAIGAGAAVHQVRQQRTAA
ncbi:MULTISPECIES: hypothetical protein [Actinomycetes]|uniref:hypothetical protein n=1 Tax=Actinomycetes TaxID=1760 RepID=UPI0033DC8A64